MVTKEEGELENRKLALEERRLARAAIATPFGPLLVDPASGIVGIGALLLPTAASAALALPLPSSPGLRGLHFPFQALVATVPSSALSNGLDITLQ